MLRRHFNPSKTQSFFLFGPRGTGKSTLLRSLFLDAPATLWIDLLTEADEDRYGRHPDQLSEVLATDRYRTVVIDEIQKAPKLLDIVHLEIEKRKTRFALTGSSARKLRRAGANLLAGRAISYSLAPLTHLELGNQFDLDTALRFGTLPSCVSFSNEEEVGLYLRSYVKSYLKEEIVAEQIVRNVRPFQDFLEVAAQTNGQIVSYAKIARDVGVDDKTIANYFEILVDTLVGFQLPPFHRSIRKRQKMQSKFYFFDPGVKRALDRTLSIPLQPKTFAFGKAFEHWVILEVHRLNEYSGVDFRFSYMMTKDDAEIDLIIERPGQPDLLIEIKSSDSPQETEVRGLQTFQSDWDRPCEAQMWSNDPVAKKIGDVLCLHWVEGLQNLFPTLPAKFLTP